ncbi:MAG: hypothetical protein AAFN77_03295 [Planctomycetota bacterium]
MANFFIIDHSLKSAGGHHFDYAQCVATAAYQLGFEVIVGANRRFDSSVWDSEFSRDAQSSKSEFNSFVDIPSRPPRVVPVFQQSTYQRDSYLAGLRHLTRSHADQALADEQKMGWMERWRHHGKHLLHRRRREVFVRRYAADCAKFFAGSPQRPGDHAFLTTISELELMGLALYLSTHPQSLHTHWHLQFHFNLFDGRTPEYDSQSGVADAIGACFLAALSRLSYHSVHFYTTSTTLADQYNRLGVCEFHSLPYPIAPHFQLESVRSKRRRSSLAKSNQVSQLEAKSILKLPGDHVARDDVFESQVVDVDREPQVFRMSDYQPAENLESTPLRLTCPGGIRREKGQTNYLQSLVDGLWDDFLEPGRVQLVAQRPKPKMWKSVKLELSIPPRATPSTTEIEPIKYVDHPLPKQNYVDLIHQTDIGLLFYDSRIYYSRRAGVLGELLACGKPVIVPAGSWLGDQLEESTFQHVDDQVKRRIGRRVDLADVRWNLDNVPLPGGVVSFDRHRHPFELDAEVAAGEQAVVLSFDWHWPRTKGIYCRIELTEVNEAGEEVKLQTRVVGVRQRRIKSNALFCLSSETVKVKCCLRNAFDDTTASLKNVELDFLTLPEDAKAEGIPTGSVGLIASDELDLIRCVEEMVTHYDHYQATVESFAGNWYARHDPKLTVRHLLAVEQQRRRAA